MLKLRAGYFIYMSSTKINTNVDKIKYNKSYFEQFNVIWGVGSNTGSNLSISRGYRKQIITLLKRYKLLYLYFPEQEDTLNKEELEFQNINLSREGFYEFYKQNIDSWIKDNMNVLIVIYSIDSEKFYKSEKTFLDDLRSNYTGIQNLEFVSSTDIIKYLQHEKR